MYYNANCDHYYQMYQDDSYDNEDRELIRRPRSLALRSNVIMNASS
jgi:hypothetical protein